MKFEAEKQIFFRFLSKMSSRTLDHLFFPEPTLNSAEIYIFLPNGITEIYLKSTDIRKPGFHEQYHIFSL